MVGHVSAIRAPSPVEVNKCCRVGETFDRNSQLCAIGATDDHWWPVIYLIAKKSYFAKQGEAPRFLRAHENTRPICDQPDLVSEGFALFSNGSLFLGERNLFIDIENFCIDKDVALVCLAHHKTADSLRTSLQLTKVKKCCTPTSYLEHARSCIPLSRDVPQQLFQTKNASHIDLIFGFPRCSSTNNNYVVADQFREKNLNLDDGTYTLENTQKVLANDEFCIDHTNQDANFVTGTVIACDDLVAVKEAPELKNEKVCCETAVWTFCILYSLHSHPSFVCFRSFFLTNSFLLCKINNVFLSAHNKIIRTNVFFGSSTFFSFVCVSVSFFIHRIVYAFAYIHAP